MRSIHDIYDNAEYEHLGYSGVIFKEFDHDGLHFYINRGATSSGGHDRIPAYHITVSFDAAYCSRPVELFGLYVYDGGVAYTKITSQLVSESATNFKEVADAIFVAALRYGGYRCISSAIGQAFADGKARGETGLRAEFHKLMHI